jgi:arylsulfatase A-like enzyme
VTLNCPADRHHLLALYDAEIAFNDEHFGRLVDSLRERGVYRNTVLVLLADHGEAFYDHRQWQHGTTLYEEEVRIPLLLKLPSWWDTLSPGRVAAICGQVDVLPTLLEVSGLAVPSHLPGRSLVELALADVADRTDRRPLFAHLEVDRLWEDMVVRDGHKLLTRPAGPHRQAWSALFDLVADPGERFPLPVRSLVMRGRLDALLRQHLVELPARHPPTRPEVDAQTREMLRLLGYSTAAP